ncbi:putative virus X resistance protein-like, coiled-coil [Helianthus annuus]|nr:putative virus X resistance protein-like, coiled-coil [Helianthus annuus]
MADAAVSALVNLVFEKLADEAIKKYARAQGIHSELHNLGRELSLIQALLHDASEKEVTEKSVGLWLNRLQHAAYDIEDVLDDVATEAMRRELTQESGASTSKVRKLIVSTCCTNFSLSHRLSPKIDSITIELQRLYKEKGELGLTVKDGKQKDPNRGNETSLPEPNVFGRVAEKDELLKKLLGDDGSSKENFSIVPIVGMGGVGKTTLARLLYNDTKVEAHFELRAWVCVSDDFDLFKISKIIFQAMSGDYNKEFGDLNQIQIALKEKLKDKRFLIVVDDVWTESKEKWEKFVLPFHSGALGSRIIMTTRKKELLDKLDCGDVDVDLLESLSFEDALSLFAFHALGVNSFVSSCPTLREKCEGIVNKCGTLPLALKAIGSLLWKKPEEIWDDVLESKIWDLKYVGDLSADWKAIFPVLMLSYHDLPSNLKRLFAYCSLFPKDFLFNKEELVLLWMAEGFINESNANKSLEYFGQKYFEPLVSRSFFQQAPNDTSLYVMHDLMNDLATFVAEDFVLRFENHTEPGKEALTNYRHMSFVGEKYETYQKFEPFKRARSLRTLLGASMDQNPERYFSSKILVDLLPQLPLLRVLSLSGIKISEVPDYIGSLKHLRYLNLSRTDIKELPENIGNLFNLQTLIIFGCWSLNKLPKSFSKLKKLQHFDFRDTPSLIRFPLGIGELKSLQTLTKIVIGGDGGIAITELKGLNNLGGELSIEGLCKVQSAVDAHEAQLSLKRLTRLELNWGEGSQHGTPQKEVLKELKPDSEWLKELAVKSYGGIEFPKWVGHPSFHRLVHVSISDCENCTSLPPLGQLPLLKELYIRWMPNVKFIGSELTGTNQLTVAAFPSLEILRFKSMHGWEVWSTNNEVSDAVFPCLRELQIEDCPKLIEVSLKTLLSVEVLRFKNISGWEGWSTNSEVSVLPSLTELHIESCPNMNEFSPGKLPKLKTLHFEDMLGWKTWSTNDANFSFLQELHINNCPELIDVSAEALPSLRVLEIAECGDGVLRSLVRAASSIAKLEMSSISGLSYEVWRGVIERIGAVEEVRIKKCNEIRYLWESEEEASKVLVNIKKLEVYWCSNLVSLGEKEEKDNFGSNLLSSLRILDVSWCANMERCCCPNNIESLDIRNCSSLTHVSCPNNIESLDISYCSSLTHVSFPTAATGGGLKLKSLDIFGCEKLMEKISSGSMPMLESIDISEWTNLKSIMQLGNFIYLTELYLNNCPSLESFPDIQLPVLTRLRIVECNSMESLSALQMTNLSSLKDLQIRDCRGIDASCHGGVWPPNLCSLETGGLKKPMSEWGPQNFPSSLVDLTLYGEPDVRNFRQLSHLFPSSLTHLRIIDFEKLESLSMGLQHLTSLQHLSIWRCPKMKHLPKQLMPSLLSLDIYECPKLRKRCEGRGSHYYPLISHIPCIDIYQD